MRETCECVEWAWLSMAAISITRAYEAKWKSRKLKLTGLLFLVYQPWILFQWLLDIIKVGFRWSIPGGDAREYPCHLKRLWDSSFVPDVKSAEKLLHEYEVETTTSFVMYYSCGVGKGKSKVRGAPQMNSSYERECYVEGYRSVGVMGRPRGEEGS